MKIKLENYYESNEAFEREVDNAIVDLVALALDELELDAYVKPLRVLTSVHYGIRDSKMVNKNQSPKAYE